MIEEKKEVPIEEKKAAPKTITKLPRTEKQLANDQLLGEMARKRQEEMAKKEGRKR